MKKRMIAIALCLVMVSAFTVTTAMSASVVGNGKSNIRTFDVYWFFTSGGPNQAPVGKATLNVETGHLVVNLNLNKIRAEDRGPYEDVWLWIYHGDVYDLNNGVYIYNTPSGMLLTAHGTATLDTYIDTGSILDWMSGSDVGIVAV